MPGLSGCRPDCQHTRGEAARHEKLIVYETNSFLLHPAELVPFNVREMWFTLGHQRQKQWFGEVREIFFVHSWIERTARQYIMFNNNTSLSLPNTHGECASVFHRISYFTSCAGKQKQMTKDDERRRRKNGICKTQKKCRDSFERITLSNLCVFCSCSNCGSCRHYHHRRHYTTTTDDNSPTDNDKNRKSAGDRERENRTGAAIYDKKTHNRIGSAPALHISCKFTTFRLPCVSIFDEFVIGVEKMRSQLISKINRNVIAFFYSLSFLPRWMYTCLCVSQSHFTLFICAIIISCTIQNRNLSTLHLGINFYFISHPITSHFPAANFWSFANTHFAFLSHTHWLQPRHTFALASRISSFDKCNKNFRHSMSFDLQYEIIAYRITPWISGKSHILTSSPSAKANMRARGDAEHTHIKSDDIINEMREATKIIYYVSRVRYSWVQKVFLRFFFSLSRFWPNNKSNNNCLPYAPLIRNINDAQ